MAERPAKQVKREDEPRGPPSPTRRGTHQHARRRPRGGGGRGRGGPVGNERKRKEENEGHDDGVLVVAKDDGCREEQTCREKSRIVVDGQQVVMGWCSG